ncbi:MAG: transposase, partial [Candidatus Desantisbacteria bacterium]
MARIKRVVIPYIPHHITQRGNRRQEVFFCQEDYELYIELMREECRKSGVEIWAYCLMPNHVHLIAVPKSDESLSRGIGEAHRRYTRMINFREGWQGYLWQGRFASFPMDERYLLATARYIELNPVRAKLVQMPWEYEWSSANAHMTGKDDKLIKTKALLSIVENWEKFLMSGLNKDVVDDICHHTRTGRPLGSEEFIVQTENML